MCPTAPSCPTGSPSLTTLVTFLLTLHLPAHFIAGQSGFQFEINLPWIEKPAIFYHVGVDGLSLWLVVLVGLLAPVGVVASWNAIQTRRKVFYSLFLVQQTAMFGVFVSLDLMLYYGFWELSLVPMAILIAMYGRKDGPRAALKFFLFTFIPSAPLLVAILWLYARTGTFNFSRTAIPNRQRRPSRRRALLGRARISLRLRGQGARLSAPRLARRHLQRSSRRARHGRRRQARPLLHAALPRRTLPCPGPRHRSASHRSRRHRHSLRRMSRSRPARLLASAWPSPPSAISASSFSPSTASRFTGWSGAVYQILSHGVVDGALFLLLGALELRYATSLIDSYGGLAAKLPRAATYFVIATLAMIGLPMLSGFIGEFIILSSTFTGVSRGWAIAAALGVILGAAYMLWLVQRLFYGPESALAASKPAADLRFGELAILTPLVVLMLVMGLAPSSGSTPFRPASIRRRTNLAHANCHPEREPQRPESKDLRLFFHREHPSTRPEAQR